MPSICSGTHTSTCKRRFSPILMVAFPLDVWRHNDRPIDYDLLVVPEVRTRLLNSSCKYQKQEKFVHIIIMHNVLYSETSKQRNLASFFLHSSTPSYV